MRRSRFTEEQIIGVPPEQEAGMQVAEVCRKHGISPPTFYAWKAKFGGMSVSNAKPLKRLEDWLSRVEGHQLAKMVTPAARRAAVTAAREAHGISERRACSIIGADRTAVRYRYRGADDAAARTRLKQLAAECRRFGWRRLKLLLQREGIRMNHKKLRRLYAEERLQVRRRGGRKRALGTRAPLTLPQGPNQRWSLDFASDTLTDGRRFRILVVVDDFTRECLGLIADTSLSGARVARELTAIACQRAPNFPSKWALNIPWSGGWYEVGGQACW
jgi:putative transposase